MILGNHKNINLGTSSFEKIRRDNCLFVDKTKFIENFLTEPSDVQLVVRPRRLGKSLNLDMLKCFLTDKTDNKSLFAGTYIETSTVWRKINSSPVFLFDFKNLNVKNYKHQIFRQIDEQLSCYVDTSALTGYLKRCYESLANMDISTEGILILTELVYKTIGKRSYILIDEYDKLLTDNYNTEFYTEIKDYETHFLSAGLKGNKYLEKALLTGVMRVSRESMMSGLNNLQTYDVFGDDLFTSDFGLINEEIDSLLKLYEFDKHEVKDWYNGIKINGFSIYNIYSVLSYLKKRKFENFWGRSGTVDIVLKLINNDRQDAITHLLNGETIKTYLNERISLNELTANPTDRVFYSMLVQTGYLSLEDIDSSYYGTVKIPNMELMNVWKDFILSLLVNNDNNIRTLFDNINDLDSFSKDIEYFLNDRLSYFDIESYTDKAKVSEKTYHVFVLGILSAYEDISYKKPPLSNRESGDGRYDILFERKDFCIIFEFKSVENISQLESAAEYGLKQIDEKRYYADAPKHKPLIKTSIAFCGKQCYVKSNRMMPSKISI